MNLGSTGSKVARPRVHMEVKESTVACFLPYNSSLTRDCSVFPVLYSFACRNGCLQLDSGMPGSESHSGSRKPRVAFHDASITTTLKRIWQDQCVCPSY